MIAPPLSVEPVNVTFATSASLTRCAPASLPPDRILTTPAGTTSLISSPRRNVVRGVEGAVLTKIVLPAHKAGAILLQAMKTGAFHGTTAATTPRGLRCSSTGGVSQSTTGSVSTTTPAE